MRWYGYTKVVGQLKAVKEYESTNDKGSSNAPCVARCVTGGVTTSCIPLKGHVGMKSIIERQSGAMGESDVLVASFS